MKILPISLDEYIELMQGQKLSSVFQNPQYQLLQTFSNPAEYRLMPLKIESDTECILVPIIVRERLKGFPEFRVHVDSIISNRELTELTYRTTMAALRNMKPYRVTMESSIFTPSPFQKKDGTIRKKTSYVINLPPDFEGWLASLSHDTRSKIRRVIRKSEELGVSVRKRELDGLEDFLALFYERFRKEPEMLTSLPAVYFESLFKFLPKDSVCIYDAFYGREPIATLLVVRIAPDCFAHSTAFNREYSHLKAIELLFATCIKDLIADGFQTMNLGGIGKVKSLSQIKLNLGARPIEFQTASWKNRFLEIKKSFHLTPLKKISLEKMHCFYLDLTKEIPPVSVPTNLEYFLIRDEKGYWQTIRDDYDMRGIDEKGKEFMNEDIALARLAEGQTVFLAFRNKMLVYSQVWAFHSSRPQAELIPPMTLAQDEAYLWHANTNAFFRRLGYHKIFAAEINRILKERNIRRLFISIRADNTPSLKAANAAGFEKIGSFYLFRFRKRSWSIGLSEIKRWRVK